MDKIYLSQKAIDNLKGLLPSTSNSISFSGYHIPIHASSLFPFELMYDACDVESKMEVKIPSGEWVHGALIPEMPSIDTEPLSWEFTKESIETDKQNRWLGNFIISPFF